MWSVPGARLSRRRRGAILRSVSDAAEVDEFDALYARYRELPEGTKAEIVAGEVRVLPRPAPRHVRVTTKLGGAVDACSGSTRATGPADG